MRGAAACGAHWRVGCPSLCLLCRTRSWRPMGVYSPASPMAKCGRALIAARAGTPASSKATRLHGSTRSRTRPPDADQAEVKSGNDGTRTRALPPGSAGEQGREDPDRPAMTLGASPCGWLQARSDDDKNDEEERRSSVVDSVHHCRRRHAMKRIRGNEREREHDTGEDARDCQYRVLEEREERNEPRRVPRKEIRKRQREEEQCDPPLSDEHRRVLFPYSSSESPQEGGEEQQESSFGNGVCDLSRVRARNRHNRRLCTAGDEVRRTGPVLDSSEARQRPRVRCGEERSRRCGLPPVP